MANKTKRKNQKKHRRGGKNMFWLVMSTRGTEPLLFARKPYKTPIDNVEYVGHYKDGYYWFSRYDELLKKLPSHIGRKG